MNRLQRRVGAKFARATDVDPRTPCRPLQAGLALHQAGRFAEAELCYQRVLAIEPENPDALHLLGNVAYHVGRYDVAVALIGQAVRRNGRNPLIFPISVSRSPVWDGAMRRSRAGAGAGAQARLCRGAQQPRHRAERALSHEEALVSYDRALAAMPVLPKPTTIAASYFSGWSGSARR